MIYTKNLFLKVKKHKKLIILLSILIFASLVIYFIFSYIIYIPKYPYTQEYVVGTNNIKGDINISSIKELEIGANSDGYAVFKNPRKALKYKKRTYKDGIEIIQKEFNLGPLSQFNYKKYKNYGWQVTKGSNEAKAEALKVSNLLDIYENSFVKQ